MFRQSFFIRGFLPILFCAILWGSSFPIIKIAFLDWEKQGIELTFSLILLFAGIRFMIAGSSLLFIAKKPFEEFKNTSKKLLFTFALGQTFLQYTFFYSGLSLSNASLASLLTSTGSFWLVFLAPLLLKTPLPNKLQWFSLLLGCIGVTIAVASPGASEGRPVLGALLVVLATGSGSCATLLFRRISKTMGGKAATGFSQSIGGIGLTCLGIQAIPQLPELITMKLIIITCYLAFVSATAFSIWNYLATVFSVPLIATYRFLIPLCGVVETVLILNTDRPGSVFFGGTALVILAMILSTRAPIKAETVKEE